MKKWMRAGWWQEPLRIDLELRDVMTDLDASWALWRRGDGGRTAS